jgi:molecular chaperone Hsp33
MPDCWARYLLPDGFTRVTAAVLPATVDTARQRHRSSPLATVALGRSMVAGALLASTMREQGRVNLQLVGDGPLGSVAVDANGGGDIRASIREPVFAGELGPGRPRVSRGLGTTGLMHVLLDPLGMEYARGSSALVSGEVDEDLLAYLTQSAQVHSAVGTEVRLEGAQQQVVAAVGLLVQLIPGGTPQWVDQATEVLRDGGMTRLLGDDVTQDPDELVMRLFPGEAIRRMEMRPVRWMCTCSKERVMSAISTLGPAEVRSMIQEQGQAEATCDFCRSQYVVSGEELKAILAEYGSQRGGTTH